MGKVQQEFSAGRSVRLPWPRKDRIHSLRNVDDVVPEESTGNDDLHCTVSVGDKLSASRMHGSMCEAGADFCTAMRRSEAHSLCSVSGAHFGSAVGWGLTRRSLSVSGACFGSAVGCTTFGSEHDSNENVAERLERAEGKARRSRFAQCSEASTYEERKQRLKILKPLPVSPCKVNGEHVGLREEGASWGDGVSMECQGLARCSGSKSERYLDVNSVGVGVGVRVGAPQGGHVRHGNWNLGSVSKRESDDIKFGERIDGKNVFATVLPSPSETQNSNLKTQSGGLEEADGGVPSKKITLMRPLRCKERGSRHIRGSSCRAKDASDGSVSPDTKLGANCEALQHKSSGVDGHAQRPASYDGMRPPRIPGYAEQDAWSGTLVPPSSRPRLAVSGYAAGEASNVDMLNVDMLTVNVKASTCKRSRHPDLASYGDRSSDQKFGLVEGELRAIGGCSGKDVAERSRQKEASDKTVSVGMRQQSSLAEGGSQNKDLLGKKNQNGFPDITIPQTDTRAVSESRLMPLKFSLISLVNGVNSESSRIGSVTHSVLSPAAQQEILLSSDEVKLFENLLKDHNAKIFQGMQVRSTEFECTVSWFHRKSFESV